MKFSKVFLVMLAVSLTTFTARCEEDLRPVLKEDPVKMAPFKVAPPPYTAVVRYDYSTGYAHEIEVTSVVPGGPADKAGLKVGMKITHFNGIRLVYGRDSNGKSVRGLTKEEITKVQAWNLRRPVLVITIEDRKVKSTRSRDLLMDIPLPDNEILASR